MKRAKFSTSKSVDEVCKELEQMFKDVLGTNPKKEKGDKCIIYYPAKRFLGTDDMMQDVSITVRKVNSSLTSIKLENNEYMETCSREPNWRCHALRKAYSVLNNVMTGMYK